MSGPPRSVADTLRFDADGGVTVLTGKVELGQGIVTALAQIAAEELALPVERIRMAPTRTDRSPDEGFTAGSQSIEQGGRTVRRAGRHALQLLRAAAAAHLAVDAPRATGDGSFAAPGAGTVDYATLAPGIDWSQPVPEELGPAPDDAPRLTGVAVPRIDLLPTITGAAFLQDLHWPDMVHGRVLRPPRRGARLEAFDEQRVAGCAGVVRVVRDGSFVAVVCRREDDALRAVETAATAATWTPADAEAGTARARDVLAAADAPLLRDGEEGGPPSAAEADVTLAASYSRPFLAHASIGTSCAVARFDEGTLTVWSHSQGIFILRAQLAQALGLDPDAVTVIHTRAAGCYGHNGADDVALDAALLARAVPGRPVRVVWSREDELAWSPVGSAMIIDLAASVADGRIASWELDVTSSSHATRPGIGPGMKLLAANHLADPQPFGEAIDLPPVVGGGGDRNAVALYDVPQRWRYRYAPALPLRTSALRTLGSYANVFAIECFMDELAAACGRDPVAFRLDHLRDERARAVIEAAQELAAPAREARDDGVGLGLGFARYKNRAAYCAIVAEVDAREGLRVTRTFCAIDAGEIVNPDGLANQVEGGIIQAVSWTTKEQVAFRGDEITSRDWEAYPILRFSEVPEIELRLLDRAGEPSLGIGEAVAGPTAAAIGNAVADALGFRLRDLPISYATVARAIEDDALQRT